jgi:predicted transposase YbfD/YdcC
MDPGQLHLKWVGGRLGATICDQEIVVTTDPRPTLLESFASLPDPRVQRTQRHKLIDIVAIAILGMTSGADTWVDIAEFGRSKEPWLRQFLELPNGIPSHDTFGRVFARLDPEHFRSCFLDWIRTVQALTHGQVIAIDGKTLRRSHDRVAGHEAIHMVSAWATANHLVLGQVQTDAKSNEITAIPKLLRLLDLSGCIVTIDAMGCQRDIALQIQQQQGDYVLAVKENQQGLYDRIQWLFERAERADYAQVESHDTCKTVEKGHGRIEIRRCWVISDATYALYAQSVRFWAGINSLIKVVSVRRVGDTVSSETRYYISSLSGNARQMLRVIRSHWAIENELHWCLDVAFLEDDSRVRKDHAPENLAILRHLCLSLLKQEHSAKCGLKAKRLRAAWDTAYLLKVLDV